MIFTHEEGMKIQKAKREIVNYFRPRLEQFPKELYDLLIANGILTGGVSASIFHNDVPKDYDVYLTDENLIAQFKAMINRPEIMQFIKDVNPKYMVEVLVEGKLVTAQAVTFNNDIQVITCKVADARKHFDFVHCMPYLSLKDYTYYISKTQFDSIANKKLVVNKNAEREPDKHRIYKFIEKGWKQ